MINNLNMEKGLARSAGLKEIYMETLDAFTIDGTERMNEMTKCLQGESLDTYSIHVHGIKSALHLIGADEISKKAYELEMASSRGDFDYVKAEHDDFIKILAILVTDVKKYLENPTQNEQDNDAETIGKVVTELKEAIDTKNTVSMNKTINRLIKMSAGTDNHAAFRKISNYIMVCDYNQARELLDIIT